MGRITIPHLSPQESLLLRLAEEHLKNLLPTRLMKSLDGVFAQARRNLGPDSTAELEKQWSAKVRVVATSQPLLPPKIRPGVFEVVSDALYANRWLQLDYRNAAGRSAAVQVMPLGLAQQGARLYLVCRYKDYANERSLALHRILTARALPLTFQRPRDFDLRKYEDDGRFGFGEGQRVRLRFRIDKGAGAHLLESPLSLDQRVRELADAFEITATVVDSAMLQWWLQSFGEDVWDVRRSPAGATHRPGD